MRDVWANAPCVDWCEPACPLCGSPACTRIRTEANGDNTVTRRFVCHACHQRFKTTQHPPGALPLWGNAEVDLA